MPVYVSASNRRHALLTAMTGVDNNQRLRSGWAQVFGIPESDVQFSELGLPLVAKLVASAGDEAVRAEANFGLPRRPARVEDGQASLEAWPKVVETLTSGPGATKRVDQEQQKQSPGEKPSAKP